MALGVEPVELARGHQRDVGVRLEVARVDLEHRADRDGGVPLLVLEEDLVAVGEHHEEVSLVTKASLSLLERTGLEAAGCACG